MIAKSGNGGERKEACRYPALHSRHLGIGNVVRRTAEEKVGTQPVVG